MARLQGVYKLPNGSIPKGGTIKLRVPRDRNTTNGSSYTLPAKTIAIPIDATTGAYDSGTIPDGPYQVRRVITGAPPQGSNGGWSDVILSGTTDLQTAIDTYDPTSYTPPVVSAAQAAAAQAAQAAAAAEAAAEQVTGGAQARSYSAPEGFAIGNSTLRTVAHYTELAKAPATTSAPAGPKPLIVTEATGPGVLRHLWYAANDGLTTRESFTEDNGQLRIYLDNATTPAVDMPLNDFFCYGPRGGIFATPIVGRTARLDTQSAAYRKLFAPFHRYMRVEIENRTATDVNAVYAGAEFTLGDTVNPQFSAYHIAYTAETAAPYEHFELANITGKGQIESVYLAMGTTVADEYGFLEGNLNIYVDGELIPSLTASGIEDFFAGGWYQMPVGGYPAGVAGQTDLAGSHKAMYRFFPSDPITFNESLRVTAPVGQRGQGTLTAANVEVAGAVGVWLTTPHPADPVKLPNTSNPILTDTFTYPAGDLPEVWGEAADRTKATATGTSITFPYSSDTAAQDMRAARKGTTLPADYWVETKMRITGTQDGMDAGLVVSGFADPYYGSANHVHLTRVNANTWQVKARDDFDIPFVVNIADGSDLTNQWVWLAMKVEGTKRTAYYKLDGAKDWRPFGTWTTAKTGPGYGIYSWQAAAEFDQLNVYPLA